jgi:2-polyprenyl-3-methyl-5-hydroxy-6-metoxy-1,4-benzoquinol methylase
VNPATLRNQAFYEQFARFYPEVFGFLDAAATVAQWRALFARIGVSLPANRLESPPSLLDIGCGPGLFLDPWARSGFRVTGIDSSEAMLRSAAQSWESRNPGVECRLLHANICDCGVIEQFAGFFDVVVGHSNFLNIIHSTLFTQRIWLRCFGESLFR